VVVAGALARPFLVPPGARRLSSRAAMAVGRGLVLRRGAPGGALREKIPLRPRAKTLSLR